MPAKNRRFASRPCRIQGMDTPTTTAHWKTEDYAPAGVKFSGAGKLADSAIAPLVAQARGYHSVDDHAGANLIAGKIYSTKGIAGIKRRLQTMTNNGNDFTVIPWFSVSDVFTREANAISSATQVRPSVALEDADGKKRKYETLSGHVLPIDTHPSMTEGWFNTARRVLFTEGVLKGDSALTAQLLAAGVAVSELAANESYTVEAARALLTGLLTRIPERDRVAILEFAGVANWHSKTEWNVMDLRDREILLAFDGDLRTNRQVWRQANSLFDMFAETKKATPKLLDLGGAEAYQALLNAGHPEMKVGLDDYLSKIGPWKDVLRFVEDTLPAEPAGDEFDDVQWRVGDWRISRDGCEADQFQKFGAGEMVTKEWVRGVIRMGGRIISNTTLRTATDPNVEVGIATDSTVITSGKGEVVIELKWRDILTDEVKTGYVKGPQLLLSTLPSEWARIEGVHIDSAITLHPEWPPRGQGKAEGWVAAVKANQAEHVVTQEGWDTMGYVPTTSGHPVFVIGESVLGSTVDDEKSNHPGVNEESLPKASFYGVKDTFNQLVVENGDMAAWKAQIAADFRQVVEKFTNGKVWRNAAVAPIILACALRPTIPTATSLQVMLTGAPGTGKSWGASFMMGFYQAHPGAWSETHLPGSANDTGAAIEYARARTPLWVVDDVAPGSNKQEAERIGSTIDNTIRSGFNGTGKRRSSADGKQQKVSMPRALTVYTAENPSEVQSIRQRTVELRFKRSDTLDEGAGALEIAAMTRDPENPMSRLTAAMIRFWLNIPLGETVLPFMRAVNLDGMDLTKWSGKHQLTQKLREAGHADLTELLQALYQVKSDESARRARVFTELLLTLDVLYALGVWAGIPADDPVLRRLEGDPADPETLHGAIVKYAADDVRDFRSASNSRSLLEAIRHLFSAGYAHLANPVDPGMPPVPLNHWNANMLNRALGWAYDTARGAWIPKGTEIGEAGQPADAKDGEWIAAMNSQTSFAMAQRHFPGMVPHGQKSAASWSQVWGDEGGVLVSDRYKLSERGGLTVKVRMGNAAAGGADARTRGVPVRLDMLLGMDLDELKAERPEES